MLLVKLPGAGATLLGKEPGTGAGAVLLDKELGTGATLLGREEPGTGTGAAPPDREPRAVPPLGLPGAVTGLPG